jgi:two-component system sensor histidine kinase KdpD
MLSPGRARTRLEGLAVGLAGVVLVTWLVHLARGQVNVLSMAVCFQLLVLVVSSLYGLAPGLVTSVASAAAFNWFFVPPVHTFTIADTRNWVSLAIFVATALITSHLAAGFRRQRREAEERRRDAELLEEMAQTVLGQISAGPPGEEVARAAARALGVRRCAILLDARPPDAPGPGRPTALTPSPEGFIVPMVSNERVLGLLEVGPALPGAEPRWSTPGFATAVAGLAAVAVERGRLIEAALEAEGLRRSDELKTALLHGVSHEFRTPLTAIRTAAHALSAGDAGADADAAALIAVVEEETGRLDRLVANLLDLSRLEAGALVARLDWCAPAEIVAGAIEAAAPLLRGTPVATRVPSDLPLVRADAVLCERILVNLLHNAARHGAPPIAVEGRVAGDTLEIAVSDGGPGIAPALAGRVFEPFVSGEAAGTGVGLTLSRGLAEAQGATLRAEAGAGGARFVLAFALAPVPQVA